MPMRRCAYDVSALFFAVGRGYRNFTQTSDAHEVVAFRIVLTATSPRQVRSMPPLTHRFAMRRSRSRRSSTVAST